MSVDAEVQRLIDQSLANLPPVPDLAPLQAQVNALTARVAALETPAPQTGSGVPVIPSDPKQLLRYSAAEAGNLGPFQVLTYPDDHPTDDMERYNRFRGHAAPPVSGGYVHLATAKRADGLWDADLIGTGQDKTGQFFGYCRVDMWLRFSTDPGHWNAAWLFDTKTWTAEEIDFPEMLEISSLTAHTKGSVKSDKFGIAKPADTAAAFHRYTIERRAGFVAFSIDGLEVFRAAGSFSSKPLALLLDSKMGFPWAALPTNAIAAFMDVAGVLVTP